MAVDTTLNSLTWVRKAFRVFLTSYFRHSPDFEWDEDLKKTGIAVLDHKSDLSQLTEATARVIIRRMSFPGQTVAITNQVRFNNQMYTHGAVIPKLGMVGIYCESQNNIEAEFIADRVESILLLHREDLLEKSVGVETPRVSEVSEPVSGTGFYSVLVSVPTYTVSEIDFAHKNPQMLGDVAAGVGFGSEGLEFRVET